jgi:hypothetical protein
MVKTTDKNEEVISAKDFNIITFAVEKAKTYTDEKLKTISWLMVGVVIVCLIAFVQLIIDSFHINSATYKEYTQKIEVTESTQKINSQLLEQNIKNQELILEQQRQIKEILKK